MGWANKRNKGVGMLVSANIEQIENGWIVETATPFDIVSNYFKTVNEVLEYISQFIKMWDVEQ